MATDDDGLVPCKPSVRYAARAFFSTQAEMSRGNRPPFAWAANRLDAEVIISFTFHHLMSSMIYTPGKEGFFQENVNI